MKFKKMAVMFLTVILSMGMFGTTAFAFSEETESTTETVTEVIEETTEAKDSALTPDGNMSLLDDYGSPTGEGKQFITLITKNGNTFYLIIDRDDKGSETVHFLNLVDEADLLSLMEESAVKEYQDSLVKPEPEPTEPETTPEPEIVEPEPEKEKANVVPALILVVALVAGGGFLAFQKFKGKKGKEQEKPDPDADYVDDEEDYGYVEADENIEDEDEEIFDDEEDNEPV